VRQSVILLLCSLAGIMGGAALIGLWALGLAIVADSVAVGVYALLRDDEARAAVPQVHGIPSDVAKFIERVRGAA
jgi:phage-related minor tail protein